MKIYFILLHIISASVCYSQQSSSGPFHFDDALEVTDPENAAFKAYTEPGSNGFVTTLFSESSQKVARITFADKELTLRHGAVTAFHPNGELLFISHYKRNRLNGKWNSWYRNGVVCDSGKLVDNLPDGTWKGWSADGQLRFIRTFSESKYHLLISELTKPPRFTFLPLANMIKRDRNALHVHTNAVNSYKTLFTSGQPSAIVPLSLKQIAELNISPENNVYVPPFAKCLHHGLYMNFYPGGRVKDSGYYKNGLKEGVWQESLKNGSIKSVGFYHHGQKKNTWKFYDTFGRLVYILNYNRHGKPMQGKEFTY